MSEIFDPLKQFDEGAEHARVQRIATIAQLAHAWAKARRVVGVIGIRASREETEKLWAISDRLECACLGPREKKGTSDV